MTENQDRYNLIKRNLSTIKESLEKGFGCEILSLVNDSSVLFTDGNYPHLLKVVIMAIDEELKNSLEAARKEAQDFLDQTN